MEHDTQIARVDAVRQFEDTGEIQAVKLDPPLIQVFLSGQSQSKDYRVTADCQITLGGEKVSFEALRRGDEVVVTHGTAEGPIPTPKKHCGHAASRSSALGAADSGEQAR